ncbi:MAG: response regulator transcription factor [Pseudomonadales bacterium]|nr:response regulator transcription factor [Pseudomonadales bacterium]
MKALIPSEIASLQLGFSGSEDKPWHILIVDNDTASSAQTAQDLAGYGYQISIENQSEQALSRVLAEQPDLLLIDYDLKDCKGTDLCQKIRSDFHGSIMMLCTEIDDIDHILSLELGADECASKTMSSRVLQARVKAIKRAQSRYIKAVDKESPAINKDLLHVHDLLINTVTRQVSLAGEFFHLSAPEYDILTLLVENVGKIISREEVFLKVRGFQYDGNSRFVDVHISRLRQKIKALSPVNEIVKTVRGRGYLIIP